MRCDHFDAHRCRSCSLMGVPYPVQLSDKDARVRSVLASVISDAVWSPPVSGPEVGFRNKAKLAIGGVVGEVTLGILDAQLRGVDLRTCGLHEDVLRAALPDIAHHLNQLRLLPYDVARRRGELKYVHLTASPDRELMVRLVLRGEHQLPRVRDGLDDLLALVPEIAVVSVNLQPEHKAVLEGPREILLTPRTSLPMRINDHTLHLKPGGFFQTNTQVAAALYREARSWVEQFAPASVWDLYCGVGGFALHLAAPGRSVTGIEISAAAIDSARRSAQDDARTSRDRASPTFLVGDVTELVESSPQAPDLVVVNPPRRGIGPRLAAWLQRTDEVRHVLYSSCNAESLARDLALMPALRPVRAGLFDMFPQTHHHEMLVLLSRS